uniref:Uncharacterized protein n=1 Tax=Anopheles epiroticus TaxID=199890 RepID=A0A182PKQ8_9DIPT
MAAAAAAAAPAGLAVWHQPTRINKTNKATQHKTHTVHG